jgi:Leucine-rich repeat (LRR) protein
VGSLQNLTVLKLNYNSLDRNIPKEIGNMTKLQQLFLCGNNFFGEIPSSILNLKELKTLDDLGSNSLSMEIPMDIGNLSKITILALNNNKLTGTIPLSIQKLEKLETLQLEENLLIGEIPD